MDEAIKKNRFFITRYFLMIFLGVGAILAGTISVLYNMEAEGYLSRIKLKEEMNLKIHMEIITNNLKEVVSDLNFLSEQNELLYFIESKDEQYKNEMAREYLAFSRQKGKYDQIRFIDNMGMEKVRINYNNGTPVIVQDSQLKSKGKRYYFKETIALTRNQVFISPLDLNMENDKIEIPFKPMMRFGVPIFDSKGIKQGIIVLNYLGEQLINAIKKASETSSGNIMIINPDGYWLCSPNAIDEWGFMFGERKNRKFSNDFPGEWQQMSSSRNSQIYNNLGLFTSDTIYPVMKNLNSSKGSYSAYGDNGNALESNKYFWKIISHVPNYILKGGTRSLFIKLFLLTMILFLLASIPSLIFAQSIARRKLYRMELYHSANYDKLTDLPNRTLFADRLNQALIQSKRYKRKFALLFIDLDKFKSVNDTLGHDAGDKLLIKVSERLKSCVRESDTIARIGGDEFTIILSTITTSDNAETVAGIIVKKLADPFTIKGNETQIGASIGISVFPKNGDNTEILLKKADDAMYLAKKQGKNNYKLNLS
ncbi:MAG: GGDEF domain-containing protein [Desulfobacterales bacterium]|nr:GGDEF domain-containing protein [Desulfobacterales bacterium]